MIFEAKNTKGKARVYDQTGLYIRAVTKYNTRTREATILLLGKNIYDGKERVITFPLKRNKSYPRKALTVKVKIPGSYLTLNGKRY